MSVGSVDPFVQVDITTGTSTHDYPEDHSEHGILIYKLRPHQLDELRALFPDYGFTVSEEIPPSGLNYLESLTNVTVYATIQQILADPTQRLIYVSGDVPQIIEDYPDLIWNIEIDGDNFETNQTISSCTHHLKDSCDCAGVTPNGYLFVHSLYYYSVVEIARALFLSESRFAYSVHHPFRAASGSLGHDEVQFESSHGRVSTTRFPSFERSDLNWLYTKNYVEFYQSGPNTDEKLHLYEISRSKVTWTLTWRIVFDSKDIQVLKFELNEGPSTHMQPAPLSEPTLRSLALGQLAYGQVRTKESEYHIEQVWDQLALYKNGQGRKVYTLDQFTSRLGGKTPEDVLQAIESLENESPKPLISSL